MKDNNENDEKENQKISFEQFINDKINNSKDLNTEIKKEDLLNEINEKVENGNDNTIIEKINSIFSNNETIKIKQLKEESRKKNFSRFRIFIRKFTRR